MKDHVALGDILKAQKQLMVVLFGPAAALPVICGRHSLLPKRVCVEAGQGMVVHQLHSLDGEGLAQVSREWQSMEGVSQRHQTRFPTVRPS
jgi:hypothetical protein